MEKKTPLYDTHVKYGGKIVEFGGFLLPVQYGSGVKAEHMAVRTQCGLFDVSHMGEILVQGEKAKEYLNYVLTNDYTDLKPGYARYSPMCNVPSRSALVPLKSLWWSLRTQIAVIGSVTLSTMYCPARKWLTISTRSSIFIGSKATEILPVL